MLLAVSRLMFAWAQDGIFPAAVSAVHPHYRTPHVAIVASATMATLGVLGSHLAGDFFLGVDILVTSMLVNFLLMALSVLALPSRNPALARAVTVLPSRAVQAPLAVAGVAGARRVPRRAHLARPDDAGGRVVLAVHAHLAHRDGRSAPSSTSVNWPRFAARAWTSRLAFERCRPSSHFISRRSRCRGCRTHQPGARTRPSHASSPVCGRSPTWSVTAGPSISPHTASAMRPYVEAGLTSFDMADHYGSAEDVAGLYRGGPGGSRVQLLTKWVPNRGRSRARTSAPPSPVRSRGSAPNGWICCSSTRGPTPIRAGWTRCSSCRNCATRG